MMMETVLSRSIRVMFAGGMAMGLVANAQAQEAAPTTTQRVEVTGSSIKRAQAEGALLVQTVTREEIQKLGATSVEQLLTAVTAMSQVGASNAASGVGSSTYGESTASLRGLGSNKTLVLVNGHRLANYATDGTSVDVNSIPLAMVDHVEILKDGASGVYGSDAVAGVINFILRKNFSGIELSGYTAATKDGGGAINKVGILAGFGDYDKDRYNVTIGADLGKDSSIYGAQRSYAQNSFLNDGTYDNSATPSGALRTFVPTTLPNSLGYVPNSLRTQGSGIGHPLAPDNCAANGSSFDANFPTCRFNPASLVPLVPEVNRTNVSANFRFKLNDDTELFAEGFRSHQLTKTLEQPSPYSVSFLANDREFGKQNVYPAIIISPTSPYYPAAFIAANKPSAAGQPVTVSFRAFDGGGRNHEDIADQNHLVMGMRGAWKGYDYTIDYNHNSSDVTENTKEGYQRQIDVARLLSNNNAFNPYSQYQSADLSAQIHATNYNGLMLNSVLSNDAFNAKVEGELGQLPAGMARFAAGAVLADEKLNYSPSLAFQSGDISGYGGQALPFAVSRNSSALFGEVNVPIIKGLEADAAVRYDRYPNQSATTPKLSLRYQPVSSLLLRASYGRGFRMASLPELYTPQTFATTATFLDPVTGVRNQFNQIVGGNPDLKPERSEQSGIGFVLDPVKGLSIAVDYWKIGVKDLITTLSPQLTVQQAAAGNPAYTGLVTRDAGGNITQISALNLNAGSQKTAGIDLDLRWLIAKTASAGDFSTHLNGTYLTKFDQILPDGTLQPSIGVSVDSQGNPINAVSAGGILFRWKHQLSFDWAYQKFGLGLTQNYQSGYYDNARADDTPEADGTVHAVRVNSFATYDLQGSYAGIQNLTLRLGVKNMFNKKPPQAITLGNYFQPGYDPSYYDPHGALGYVSANYKF